LIFKPLQTRITLRIPESDFRRISKTAESCKTLILNKKGRRRSACLEQPG
jgi:hypothetical protein